MKKIIFIFLTFGFFNVQAQTPVVVSDLVYEGVGYAGFISSNTVLLNNNFYFATTVGVSKAILWKSDGTTNGTVAVKVIKQIYDQLIVFNSKVYFSGYGDDNDSELWQSDGTESGTVKIDLLTGNRPNGLPNSSSPANFYVFNNSLYFTAYTCQENTACIKLMKISGTTVPIRLLTFTGKPLNNQTQLDWQTETEINASRIDIDRSTDGQTWTKLGSVNAKNQPSNYQYIDQNPKPTEVNYYRLCMVDIDGKKEFSKIVSVKMSEARSPIKIYPSITEGSILIETALNIQQVWVSDASGQIVLISTQSTLNLGTFPTGIYMVTVKADNSIFSETVFKK